MRIIGRFITVAVVVLALAGQGLVHGNDLGTYGETFDIAEVDLLKMLGAKLKKAEQSGQIDQLNQQFAATARRHIEEPPAVQGVVHTTTPKSWLFDPSIVVPRDFADQNGRVFAHAGERINPLERLPTYDKTLVFIDGSDPAEVKFALSIRKKLGAERTLIILTGGAPMTLMRANKVPVYFDQQGILVQKFGITQVPATVERQGNLLKISEVRP
ncbi:type-F conjugative transfer system protein TraW [Asticcacaulis biprosthecium C19]|uniref:Type-F conjugative transfer system protein TraW n=1 Tax=Asticcacaulis biprosthecium C19 TaxID=715226 RepID=F4QG38_9CAUL|nr:type-F conjugative transfer system protein TraW [Asticcacaulis biprosthecium]EGF93849.1 type-F conjugative transfer system protein TraW [Asticcacaulis biprosthecium C19]